MFRIFDLGVESDIGFPGFAEQEGAIDLRIVSNHSRASVPEGYGWIHDWKGTGEEPFMVCARREKDYLLQFPGLVDYELLIDKRTIRIFRKKFCTDVTLAHLLLDQVIPRYVCHQGKAVVHASAAELKGGQMIAFTGPSGRGKSTLASSFRQALGSRVSDDCLQLEPTSDGIRAIPSYSSLRLWEDSMDAFFASDERKAEVAQYSQKKQLILEGNSAGTADASIRLAALFVLGDPPGESAGEEIIIEAIGGMEAVMALTTSTFPLDVVNRDALRRNFEAVAAVASSGVPIYQLNYLRRYSLLPKVRKAVIGVVE